MQRLISIAPLLIALAAAVGVLTPMAAADSPASMDDWVASLQGAWLGPDNNTPMGRMPFALLFERQADGSLLNHSAMNRETWIRLHFFKDDGGRWLLEEGAGMEGLGERGSVLVPAEPDGEVRRWVSEKDPDYLQVELAVDAETLFMRVMVHGKEHAQFNLKRAAEDQVAAIRAAFEQAATREPAEDSINDHANDESVPVEIREARAQVAAQPDDARIRLELAAALGATIQVDPMRMGARYSAEMLEALLKTVELDPTMPDAYQWLAGYYLNAPPIAGGSLEKAEEAARQLAKIDDAAGEALLAQVAARRQGH